LKAFQLDLFFGGVALVFAAFSGLAKRGTHDSNGF
jgi:hypothetical protein